MSFSLVIDHVTKRNKGYAFVDFATIDEASNAIKQTNGVMFYGRQLHVEFSNRGSNLDSELFQGNRYLREIQRGKSVDSSSCNLLR